ncbi:MAG: ParB/RepB/Spo0J family partition protein [Cyanobacteria bacterium J06621_3]
MYGSTQETSSVDTIPQLKEEIESLKSSSVTTLEVPIRSIIPLQLPENMKQPRLYFDAHRMELLKDSIRKHGVLEPILLRPSRWPSHESSQEKRFELISGERRWRCCQSLGITSIPAIVRPMSDPMALEAALVAHLLSEDISLIEQTESILGLLSLQLNLSLEALKGLLYQVKNSRSRRVASSKKISDQQIEIVNEILSEFGMKLSSFVANRLPLLNLASSILSAVKAGKLSPTNAVLINRQPQEFHELLLTQAQGKTKGELATLIKATVSSNRQAERQQPSEQSSRPADKSPKEKEISDRIYDRIRFVRKRTDLLDHPEVLSRLAQIDALLQEIESFEV